MVSPSSDCLLRELPGRVSQRAGPPFFMAPGRNGIGNPALAVRYLASAVLVGKIDGDVGFDRARLLPNDG